MNKQNDDLNNDEPVTKAGKRQKKKQKQKQMKVSGGSVKKWGDLISRKSR